MNTAPLVSVVIIFLNAEPFLQEAIASICAQTFTHWELLLVDDGSTDGSSRTAQLFADNHPDNVRYLTHLNGENRGMSASRNLGIRHAQGRYVAFLDADDVWSSKTLRQQVAILEGVPRAAMVYGALYWWYGWNGNIQDRQHDFVEDLGIAPNTLVEPPTLVPLFLENKAAVPSGLLIRREAICRVGGFDESFRGLFEDQVFCAKLCLTEPVFAAGQSWYRYRQHPTSSCAVSERTGQEPAARLVFLNWLKEHIDQHGITDTLTRRAIDRSFWPLQHPWLYRQQQHARNFFTIRLPGHARNMTRQVTMLPLNVARRVLPDPVRRQMLLRWKWVRAHWIRRNNAPPVGLVRFGDLRRVTPISNEFGFDRGQPVDRYYIEKFLQQRQHDIQGRVLEIAEDTYTLQFGGERVTRSDILHVTDDDPKATVIGDLATADHIPSDSFDCIIMTQTLQLIYDVQAALRTIYRILKPGGVALITFPGISKISRYDADRWGYYWSFTTPVAKRLFGEVFSPECVQIANYGNVLSATSFLYGLATDELHRSELDYVDQDFEVIIAVRAMKPLAAT